MGAGCHLRRLSCFHIPRIPEGHKAGKRGLQGQKAKHALRGFRIISCSLVYTFPAIKGIENLDAQMMHKYRATLIGEEFRPPIALNGWGSLSKEAFREDR
jgi:hypothetical protein